MFKKLISLSFIFLFQAPAYSAINKGLGLFYDLQQIELRDSEDVEMETYYENQMRANLLETLSAFGEIDSSIKNNPGFQEGPNATFGGGEIFVTVTYKDGRVCKGDMDLDIDSYFSVRCYDEDNVFSWLN